MKPFYWRGTKNFGDYLNSWLWPRVLDGYLSEEDGIRLIGVGSLLKSTLNHLDGKKVVFGTGSGYGSIPKETDYADWTFYFVRGPQTAKCFNLDPSKSIVDAAWLISQTDEFKSQSSQKQGVAFVPHWTTADSGNWKPVCDLSEIEYVDPQDDLERILRRIEHSELVITESLHGAILADYFRTPWLPVCISPKFLSFKWVDWFQSINIEPSIINLPLSDYFDFFYNGCGTSNISFNAKPIEMECEPIAPETSPSANRGPLYKYNIRAKRILRSGRRRLLQSLSSMRDVPPLGGWNRRHRKKLSDLLEGIKGQRPFLSSDSTHAKIIDRLTEVTNKLKSDYNEGKLFE